jgi:cobalt-zinc-cadmium resistance protein CzcA
MIKQLIRWAVNSPLVVVLLALMLVGFGLYAFQHVNVEAYPDPAPAIVEVVAQYPGASAEEVERQVTIPLEVALAGMPKLTSTKTQSLFELCHIRNQFEYGVEFRTAKQEVINRLQQAQLPAGVVPQISPESPVGEIFRYTLSNPKDAEGKPIYSLNDLKSLQDYTLERQFRRVPRIDDVASYGGTVKRYEIHLDPARMQRYGISLQQIKDAISSSNANIGAQYLIQGEAAHVVRSVGLIGQGQDPMDTAMAMTDPIAARDYLRAEDQRRIREIRQTVVNATNNVPIHVDDLVEGGALKPNDLPGKRGVVVGFQTRLGRVMRSRPLVDAKGNEVLDGNGRRKWVDDDDVVQGIVLLRNGEQSLPALEGVRKLVRELNETPGRLLPGVRIEVLYDRTDLIHVTTHTVRENLLVGMGLVTVVLLMFLSNVRCALIVAINVPLALLFAFVVLFLRGKSANLLSIGAVDFGIIVDSSVIIVENIYRHLSGGMHAELPLRERILRAAGEIDHSLFFSTAIMVCAFVPLFTMAGPEGQIFGPMADTYAFALGGALLLALTLAPVLCAALMGRLKPTPDNWMVRRFRTSYLRQLRWCLAHPWITLAAFVGLIGLTIALLPLVGREFMPELDEGGIWIQAMYPLNSSLEESCRRALMARDIMKQYPEVEEVFTQVGRPDDGTDPSSFYFAETYLPLKPHSRWPIPAGQSQPRSKEELSAEINRRLDKNLIAVDWNFSQYIRNMVMEVLSGVRGENSIKIIGPELSGLESLAEQTLDAIRKVPGIENASVYHIMGQMNLTFPIDRRRCALWNVKVGDVQDALATAVGGKPFTQMVEGERNFDVILRWPAELRSDQDAILKIPIEVPNNNVLSTSVPGLGSTSLTGAAIGPSALGVSASLPPITGSARNAAMNDLSRTPRRRLKDFVSAVIEPGASDIYREQGNRLIAIKFDVRGRDLAGAVAEAKKSTEKLFRPPYRAVWSGEFEEMEQAEARLLVVIPLAVVMVMILLYIAFRSLTDVLLVLSNVLSLCCGGIWALLLTHTNFSISAAVGFISIFGVAVMDGLLLVSSFNRLRLAGMPVHDAILEGCSYRLRPILMTGFTAVFGLLPAALSTRIGAQTQRPLAIVVIGGMLVALFLLRYLTPVLYLVFRQAPPSADTAQLVD